jgi:phage shock protein A
MSRHLTNMWMEYAKKLERRLTKLQGDFRQLRTEVDAWEIRQAELARNINRLKKQIEMLMDIHGMDIDMPSTRSRASSL